jgi:tRNA(Ile)-lysidine synthase
METWPQITLCEGERAIEFDRETWQALPRSLQRATLREAIRRLRRSLRNINWVHVENALWLALEKSTGAQATLPQGLVLTIGPDRLTVSEEDHRPPLPDLPLLQTGSHPLSVPGTTDLPCSDWQITSLWISPDDLPTGWRDNADRWQVFLDAAAHGQLSLRVRQPGDRFQPLGMEGRTVALADFLINIKMPRALRDLWPLLVGSSGILWIVGHRQDERTRVTSTTQRVLVVRAHRRRARKLESCPESF